jgi:hypothetical protein
MADSNQTPTLPSTADQTPYVPVSWMAVAAVMVSGLYVITLISLGAWEYIVEKKPLLATPLLFVPVVGVILSFAGRRVIRNSEGTRTGERLVNAAWWGSVIAGLGYAAYYLAIDYSIHRDAENEVQAFMGYLLQDDASKPVRENLNEAFIRTLDPGRRRTLKAKDQNRLEAEFRDPYLAFKQVDIVRMVQRNKGECEFFTGGVKEWVERTKGVDCVFSGTLKCREGSFPLYIPLKGIEGDSTSQSTGREWMVIFPQAGFFTQDKVTRTPYGWLIEGLEQSGIANGRDFLTMVGMGPSSYPFLYHMMVEPYAKREYWDRIALSTPARSAVGGGLASMALYITPDSANYFKDDFFKLPGGGEPSPEQKNQFKESWELLGLTSPGMRLKNSPDHNAITIVTENAVETHLPCELPIPGPEQQAARCRLIFSCKDPSILEDLKRLRAEAKADEGTFAPPESLRTRIFPWRLLRVETDMYPIRAEAPPAQRMQMPTPPAPPSRPGGAGGAGAKGGQ